MNSFLVPANTKKSTLILGFLRGIDAIILAVGVVVSIALLLIIGDSNNTWLLLACCLPGMIAGMLIYPISNYHNVLVFIQSLMRFYQERRNYVWKGWCIYDEFKDDK